MQLLFSTVLYYLGQRDGAGMGRIPPHHPTTLQNTSRAGRDPYPTGRKTLTWKPSGSGGPNCTRILKHFRMTGGEPMMDHNTYKVFQYIIDHPKSDLHLNVTSNMCPPDEET